MQVGDSLCDCPSCEDEQQEGEILFCPPATSAGTVPYLTFATDPGATYATTHKQQSISPSNPCVFPFRFDADGDGIAAEHNTCTKSCTTHSDVPAIQLLNPPNTLSESNTLGCEEHCQLDGSGNNVACQKSRLWCATEVDDNLYPTKAVHCSESCAKELLPDQMAGNRLATEDDHGHPCNPYLVMPYLSSRARGVDGIWHAETTGNLNWTFTENWQCNYPSDGTYGDCDPPKVMTKNPLDADFKFYLLRSLTQVSSVQMIVYHPSSPYMRTHLPCGPSDKHCCNFAVRIIDNEDPALQYPPFGPAQHLDRCSDVTECQECQYEESMPSASSDRVCIDHTPCGACQYESQVSVATAVLSLPLSPSNCPLPHVQLCLHQAHGAHLLRAALMYCRFTGWNVFDGPRMQSAQPVQLCGEHSLHRSGRRHRSKRPDLLHHSDRRV